MCEYCGCRDIALIGRLSEEHYQAVDGLGVLRRAIDSGDGAHVKGALDAFAAELFPHNDSEEAGLFHELVKDEYFEPTVTELIGQHRQFRALVGRIGDGDWDAYHELEETLRHHIDREENGLFPATAVAVDGPTWEEIDRLTHEFNHQHHREHGHTEGEQLKLMKVAELAEPVEASTLAEPVEAPVEAPVETTQLVEPVETTQLAEPVEAPKPTRSPQARRGPVVESSGGYSVRTATSGDAAALVALWRQCGLTINAPDLVAGELASVSALHPELALVAVSGDSIIGSVLGTWDGRRAWVNRLATRRDWQGRGVATALLDAVEAGVRKLGGHKVNLLIEAENYAVVEYYEARGYAAQDLIFMEKFFQ